MLIPVMVAIVILAGAPWQAAAALLLATVHPVAFLAAVAAWAIFARRRRARAGPDDEAAFLRGLAAELSAGAGLRAGVLAATGRSPALDLERASRLCSAGRSAEEIGAALGEALPVNRTAVAAAFRLSAATGGAIAPLVETLAHRAEAMGRLERERTASTAQARLSAWIVGGLPVGLVLLALVTGIGPGTGGLGSVGTGMVVIGCSLIAAGAGVVAVMARRIVG